YDALITYAPIVEHILGKREERAEAEGLKLLRRKAELIMQENFIEPSYILSYLILSELECRDLTLMALALRHGLDHKSLLSYEI
ncbi:MAG: hypothetical protein QXF26_09915, partial [Candidatus Bathyarchaeia archaeon]